MAFGVWSGFKEMFVFLSRVLHNLNDIRVSNIRVFLGLSSLLKRACIFFFSCVNLFWALFRG